MFPFFVKSIKPPQSSPAIKVKKPAQAEPIRRQEQPAGLGHFSHLLAMLAERHPGGDFGPHNVEEGHHVAFAAGTFVGAGKVSAVGRDGVTVADERQREHRVHWREVTGHFAPPKATRKAKPAAGASDAA
ncbi:MAG TPA: hypothetical protein VF472_07275 [Burkholderiaceae bacterium]